MDILNGISTAIAYLLLMETVNLLLKTVKNIELKVNGVMIIAHPPCTFLTASGNAWFNIQRYGEKAIQRYKDRLEAINFFMQFVFADCERIAIENPIGIMSGVFKAPTQIIQPYEFGDEARKTTCLWLKGLPTLFPTKMVKPELVSYECSDGKIATFDKSFCIGLGDNRGKARSKTFPGIAKAIAEQWG